MRIFVTGLRKPGMTAVNVPIIVNKLSARPTVHSPGGPIA
jgi:hypothetical protein